MKFTGPLIFTTLALVKNLALQRKGIGTLIVHNLHLVYLKKEEKNQTKIHYFQFVHHYTKFILTLLKKSVI